MNLKGEVIRINTANSSLKRSGFLDMMKMIFIIFVIITHLSWSNSSLSFFIFPYLIDMAVPVFIIISCYLRSKKIERMGFKKFISIPNSLHSFNSIIFAYTVAAVIELILSFIKWQTEGLAYDYLHSFRAFIKWFFWGLGGPGSYYMPIMVQLIFFYPIIFLLVSKLKIFGLLATFLLNLGYEIYVFKTELHPYDYRLWIFRYTFLIGLGIYFSMSKGRKKDDIIAAILLTIGAVFITINSYIRPFSLFQAWKTTSMLCVPFAYGLVYFLKKAFGNISYRKAFIIGRASLHIYLVQMIFYGFDGEDLLNAAFGFMPTALCCIFKIIAAIAICVSLGLLFFISETKLRGALKKKTT